MNVTNGNDMKWKGRPSSTNIEDRRKKNVASVGSRIQYAIDQPKVVDKVAKEKKRKRDASRRKAASPQSSRRKK